MDRRSIFVLAAIFAFGVLVRPATPARADLRLCDQSATDSQVVGGHFTQHDGLTVRGTYIVKRGTCGVILPGRLTARAYFIRVVTNGQGYGMRGFRLCTASLAHFTFNEEDKPSFHCSGGALPPGLHIAGLQDVPLHLADFMRINTNGESTLVVTQSKTYNFHFELRK